MNALCLFAVQKLPRSSWFVLSLFAQFKRVYVYTCEGCTNIRRPRRLRNRTGIRYPLCGRRVWGVVSIEGTFKPTEAEDITPVGITAWVKGIALWFVTLTF